MEPTNRPYVDPDTEPGDAGTEPWADGTKPAADDLTKRRRAAASSASSEEGAATEGSPADQFLTDDDAVGARSEDPAQSEGS